MEAKLSRRFFRPFACGHDVIPGRFRLPLQQRDIDGKPDFIAETPLQRAHGHGDFRQIGKRFRVLSLNDNVSWMTAIGNDYAYEDIFVRQLQNYGRAGDIALGLSVSGNSPNVVNALDWAKKNDLHTIALVGAKRGRMAEVAHDVIVINDTHYGRVEDAQMGICHMLCYAFMEKPEIAR